MFSFVFFFNRESLDSESSRSTRVSSGSKPSSSSTRTLRKPRSSPSLKHSERRVISGPLPALPNALSSTSPRRSRNSSHSRPQISHPLPHPLDPHNPKLSSPSLVNLSSNNTYNNTSYSTSTSWAISFSIEASCPSLNWFPVVHEQPKCLCISYIVSIVFQGWRPSGFSRC